MKNPFLNFSLCLSVALATTLTSCQYIPGLKKSKQAPIAARPAMGAPAQPRQAVASNPYRGTGARNPDSNLPSTLPAGVRTRYSSVPTNEMVLAMTFDDGPHPTYTPRLLDMLKERNIKATFFVVGKNAQAYPGLIRRIVAEGHELANHSWSHCSLPTRTDEQVRAEFQKTADAVKAACGLDMKLMRPPYGATNKHIESMAYNDFGYVSVLWSVDPQDWREPGIGILQSRLLNAAHKGAIMLCHDIHGPTVTAMPRVFDELLARGYRFVTCSQLINLEKTAAPVGAAPAAPAASNAAAQAGVAPALSPSS